jgi:hypothetical protein
MNTPRNIISIDRLQAGQIIGLRRVSSTLVSMSAATPWQPVAIRVPARLTVSDKLEDGVRLYTAQLVFRTCQDTGERERYVYRCRTADGRYLLVGGNSRPYPVSNVTSVRPDNMTDSQLDEVAVSYVSTEKIPYIQ